MVGDLMKREIVDRLETGVVACDTEAAAGITTQLMKRSL